MKQIYSDLWQTLAEHPYHGVTTHAYLLVQDAGNILFYSSGLSEEQQHIRLQTSPTFAPTRVSASGRSGTLTATDRRCTQGPSEAA